MFCKNCGKEINDQAVVCPGCGCATGGKNVLAMDGDASSFGYAFLGFLIPIVGLILFLMWKNDYPLRAKSAGKGALISVIVSVVLLVIYYIIIFVALGSLAGSYY